MAAVIVTMAVFIGGKRQIGLVSQVRVMCEVQDMRVECPGGCKIQ